MKRLIACVCFSLLTGCAFVVNGGKQDVTFDVSPGTADIKNGGKFLGTGTASASLDRGTLPNIVVSAEGYQETYVSIQRKINAAWMFWDVATCVFPIALCIPLLVDAVSGSWYGYEDHAAIKLRPLPKNPEPTPPVEQKQPAAPVLPAPQQQIIIIK